MKLKVNESFLFIDISKLLNRQLEWHKADHSPLSSA